MCADLLNSGNGKLLLRAKKVFFKTFLKVVDKNPRVQ